MKVFIQIKQSSCTVIETQHNKPYVYKTGASVQLGARLLTKTKPNSFFFCFLACLSLATSDRNADFD